MHITRIHVRSFKRFHDLTVEVEGTPRLVVMCGPNGIGKSSLIDAVRLWDGGFGSRDGWVFDDAYHRRAGDTVLNPSDLVTVEFAEPIPPDTRKLIYARSAYRHEPDFQSASISRQGEIFSAPRARRMIDPEAKVSDNYQRLISATIDALYSGRHDAESVASLREVHIGRVREVMRRLFPGLELQGPGDPVGGGTFYFSKDGRPEFHYKNLSGGEKAAFDVVLDLAIKTVTYDDTVFFIDEPELHMNPRLQGALLEQMLELTPDDGQLWVATHSIGMMRKAYELWSAENSAVAFLDFEGHDFDAPVVLTPTVPTRDFWAAIFKVALGDLAQLLAPDRVVLCEGRPGRDADLSRVEFDARCYRTIFGREFPLTDFISVGNAVDVQSDRMELGRSIQALVSGTEVLRVVDRDMRTPDEVRDVQESGTRVLGRRHLESYLLDAEVIAALCQSLGKVELTDQAVAIRDAAVAASVERGKDPDDMKSAAGEFYVGVRRLLALTGAGNSTDGFLANTMAPLIVPSMRVYQELKADIFG